MDLRAQVRSAVDSAGLLPAAKRARGLVSPRSRRAQRDDAHLGLLLAFLLREDSTCIDVGANRGDVIEQMVRRSPHGRHLAFEPLPAMAAELRRRVPGVTVREEALAAEPGRLSFVHVTDRPEYSGLLERDHPGRVTETIEVAVSRLDDVVAEVLGEAPVALIKVDVEGAELGVLQGGLATLRRDRPVVVLEHGLGGADRYGTTPEQVHELLVDDVGLRLFDLEGGGPYSAAQLRAAFDANTFWNWVAKP